METGEQLRYPMHQTNTFNASVSVLIENMNTYEKKWSLWNGILEVKTSSLVFSYISHEYWRIKSEDWENLTQLNQWYHQTFYIECSCKLVSQIMIKRWLLHTRWTGRTNKFDKPIQAFPVALADKVTFIPCNSAKKCKTCVPSIVESVLFGVLEPLWRIEWEVVYVVRFLCPSNSQ